MSTLRDTIREALSHADGPVSPAQIAEQVASKIAPKDRQAALTEALPHLVREVIMQTRPSTPATTTAKSWKRDAIRAAERIRRTELDALYATPDGYKPLRLFSYAEMVALADTLQEQAEKNAAQSARMRRFAAAMDAAGVATFGDLDDDALAGLGVAA